MITVIQGSHLPIPEMVGRRLKPGEGISGRAIQSRRPVILDSYAGWPHSVSGLAEKITDAAIAVPLISDGLPIGALTISDDTPGRRFTEDDAQTLSLLALQAALVLEGARRHEQAGRDRAQCGAGPAGRDLHDGLAQDLAALLLRADACQALLGEGNEALRDQLEVISVGLQRAIRDARATISRCGRATWRVVAWKMACVRRPHVSSRRPAFRSTSPWSAQIANSSPMNSNWPCCAWRRKH